MSKHCTCPAFYTYAPDPTSPSETAEFRCRLCGSDKRGHICPGQYFDPHNLQHTYIVSEWETTDGEIIGKYPIVKVMSATKARCSACLEEVELHA